MTNLVSERDALAVTLAWIERRWWSLPWEDRDKIRATLRTALRLPVGEEILSPLDELLASRDLEIARLQAALALAPGPKP